MEISRFCRTAGCILSVLTLAACSEDSSKNSAGAVPRNSLDETSVPAVQTETKPTPTVTPVKPLYRGEVVETEVAPDDMLQVLSWIRPPSTLAVAVQMNRLNGTVDLTTATSGRVLVPNTTAPLDLALSADSKYLFADVPTPVHFPLQTTFSLSIKGEHARETEQGFSLREFSTSTPLGR